MNPRREDWAPREARKTSRLLVWIVGLTFAVLVGAAVVTYLAYQQASAELVIERDRELAFYSAGRLEDELAKLAGSVETLSRAEDITQGEFAQQRAALTDARHRLSVYDAGVVLMDSRGIVIGTEPWRPEIHGWDWSNRPFFRQLLTSPTTYISDATGDGPEGHKVVVISAPILGGRGEIVGALAGMFKLGEPTVSSLYASIVRLRLPQTGNAYLVDRTGRLLYDSQGTAVGGTLADVGLQQVLVGGTGAIRTTNAEGNDIVAAFAPVSGSGWTLILEDDWELLTASSRRYANILVGLLGTATLLPVAAVLVLWRQRNAQILGRDLAEQEMHLAHMMQAALLPKHTPMLPGWMLAAYHQPAESECHDFYDLLLTPDGRLMLVLGEVSLSGTAATMAMSIAHHSLRSAARSGATPSEALVLANAALFPELPPNERCHCMFAWLDPLTGHLEYAAAGLHAPFLLGQPDGQPAATSAPLGEAPEVTCAAGELSLPPGGQVVFYGRGGQADGELPLSVQQLHEVVQRLPEDCDDPSEIFSTELRELLGYPSRREHDLTILALRRRAESG